MKDIKNKQISDLIEAIPDVEIIGKIETKLTIESLLRTAYWRGVFHYRTDPKGTDRFMDELLLESGTINFSGMNDGMKQ